MSEELPKGWVESNLQNMVLSRKGKKPKHAVNEKKDGYVPYLLIDEMEGKPIRKYTDDSSVPIAREDDVLIVWDGSIGKTATGLNGAIGSTIVALSPVIIPTNFLEYFLKTAKPYIEQTSRGTGLQHINQKTFWPMHFPLPPLNEQKRIVAKLDAIMPRIEAVKARLDKVPGILKRFRQSVLTAAVTGKLTEQWREEHPEVGEWEEKTLQDVTDYQGGYAYKSTKFIESSDNQVLKIANVKVYGVDIDIAPSFIDDEYAKETERFMLKENDVIISMTGTRNKRDYGFNGIIRQTTRKLFLNQRVARLRCHEKQILPEILSLILKTPEFRDFFFKDETGNVNQGNVGADTLKLAPLLLPPLEEQKEIVRQVDKLFALADKVEAHYQKAKARVDKLSQSVLAKAFRGELVPQDPNDEPAEKLLERILEEKGKFVGSRQTAVTSKPVDDSGGKKYQ